MDKEYPDTEIVDETGNHKVVTQHREYCGFNISVERPMTRYANGKWRMSKPDRKRYEANLREASRDARGVWRLAELHIRMHLRHAYKKSR